MYCVTDKKINFLEKLPFYLGAVGKDNFDDKYILSNTKNNIYHKEKNYSELTFHYWIWKNELSKCQNTWIGFCQKRRFWICPEFENFDVNQDNLKKYLLLNLNDKFNSFESIICKPIDVSGAKKTKLIKRGWRNLLKDPDILFNKKKQSISLHFDMHHGYKNLEIASELLEPDDRNDFREYINRNTFFNPHIMFITKPEIAEKWFTALFSWLEKCENKFGFDSLQGYDTTRLYAYLAERYLSFWFKKYTKFIEFPYVTLNFEI